MASVLFLTLPPLVSSTGIELRWPQPLAALDAAIQPFMSFNGYGLFRVMTTERHEILVEGSNDGETWKEYSFRWKPSDPMEMPGAVAPHQPRLDWQMWFAALSDWRSNPWFIRFLVRILEGSPDVLGLLRADPFPGHPPRYVRALVYDYHFTKPGQAGWWTRKLLGLYCPVLTLENGHPAAVELPPGKR